MRRAAAAPRCQRRLGLTTVVLLGLSSLGVAASQALAGPTSPVPSSRHSRSNSYDALPSAAIVATAVLALILVGLGAYTRGGFATMVDYLSPVYWLSCLALFFTGAFDSISVVIRQTILQLVPPDHLRGRVQSVNSMFISASNELGAFESGLAARLLGTVPSVVFGGAVTLATVTLVWRRSRDLLAERLLHHTRS